MRQIHLFKLQLKIIKCIFTRSRAQPPIAIISKCNRRLNVRVWIRHLCELQGRLKENMARSVQDTVRAARRRSALGII